jgi:hypothetical protein
LTAGVEVGMLWWWGALDGMELASLRQRRQGQLMLYRLNVDGWREDD